MIYSRDTPFGSEPLDIYDMERCNPFSFSKLYPSTELNSHIYLAYFYCLQPITDKGRKRPKYRGRDGGGGATKTKTKNQQINQPTNKQNQKKKTDEELVTNTNLTNMETAKDSVDKTIGHTFRQ